MRATSIMLYLQVFAVYMLLKHAAEYEPIPGSGAKTAADKTQLTPAAKHAAALLDGFHSLLGALTEVELMQMGLPALRLVMWPYSCYVCVSLCVCLCVCAHYTLPRHILGEHCGILLCGCCCVFWTSRNSSLVPTGHALSREHINLHAPNKRLL